MLRAGSSERRRVGSVVMLSVLLGAVAIPAASRDVEVCPEFPSTALGAADTISRLADTAAVPATRSLGSLSEDCAIVAEPVYTGEVFTNTRGGISTRNATKYQALLDVPLTVDFEKSGLPLPGRFFLLGQSTHGQGLTTEFIGDTQVISNIDSNRNIMQVSEFWWEFGLPCDCLSVRLGKQDLNTEFLVMDLAGDFIQSSFGLSPSSGFPSYPNPSMAALLQAQLRESLKMKVGIWDALGDGRTWGFSGNEVTYLVGELEYKYALMEGRLSGGLDVGVSYISGGDYLGQSLPSGRGWYVQLEQLVYRENAHDEGDTQGLGVFASHYPRYAKRDVPITAIWSDVVGGVVYEGPLSGRDEDVIGAGVAWARLNKSGSLQETAVEFFYKAQITPSIAMQPDLQYIVSPSGIHRDALAVGLRFEVVL